MPITIDCILIGQKYPGEYCYISLPQTSENLKKFETDDLGVEPGDGGYFMMTYGNDFLNLSKNASLEDLNDLYTELQHLSEDELEKLKEEFQFKEDTMPMDVIEYLNDLTPSMEL